MKILNRFFMSLLLAVMMVFVGCEQKPTTELRVLQMNTLGEGAVAIGDGFLGINQTIEEVGADVVLLQEIRGQEFIDNVIEYFKSKGITYYGYSLNISTAILSKYPIQSVRSSDELGDDSYAFVKANIKINDTDLVFYSMHLDWKHLSFYNLRGFDGHSSIRPYAEIEPETDVEKLLAESDLSRRNEEVSAVIEDAKKEIANGRIVILGGDFNEPSFLDWGENTSQIRDHRGLVINWTCSSLLNKAGFKDAYRVLYPNAVTHPGFTCNAGNKDVPSKELYWAYGVDDRERIDQTYYFPDERIELVDATVIGPKEDYWDNKIQYEETEDPILTPKCLWPSDHKAVLTVYELESSK